MKKFLLSGTLVLAFVVYGLHQRKEDAQAVAAVGLGQNTTVAETTPLPTTTADFATADVTATPTATSTSRTTSTPTPTPKPASTGQYKDGSYTGNAANAYYGYIQVQAVIRSGRIAAVNFLQYPNDRRTSIEINTQAMPYLQQEAIQAQSANVNGVSGASDSSAAFIESLSNALAKAH